MDLQEFKTEGEGKKRDERCYRPQGKRTSRTWEGARSHTAWPHCEQQTHSTLGSLRAVVFHLCALRSQETPSFLRLTGLDRTTCAEKVSHAKKKKKKKAQLMLYNGFFKKLSISVSL